MGLAIVTDTRRTGKEDLGNYRPLSLRPSVPLEVTEQIILSAIAWHVQGNKGIRSRQNGLMEGRL